MMSRMYDTDTPRDGETAFPHHSITESPRQLVELEIG
jgi:hypothetical protein